MNRGIVVTDNQLEPPLRLTLEQVRWHATRAQPRPARHGGAVSLLLGKVVVRRLGGRHITGRIVETEAYLQGDPACHAFRGMTPRNRSLFLDVGHAYVYLCYGTSWMLNVSSEGAGTGAGVLLRALEPLCGIEHMRRGREQVRLADLARGPGRLAAALRIDRRHDGVDLFRRGRCGSAATAPGSARSARACASASPRAARRVFAFSGRQRAT